MRKRSRNIIAVLLTGILCFSEIGSLAVQAADGPMADSGEGSEEVEKTAPFEEETSFEESLTEDEDEAKAFEEEPETLGEDADIDVDESEDVMASGSYGNTTWSISSKGKLVVSGTGNAYDEYDYPAWSEYADDIESAEIRLSGVTMMGNFFTDCYNLKSVDFSKLDASKVKDMSYMFIGDFEKVEYNEALTELDMSGLDTSSLENMEGMFQGCTKLKTLKLDGFNTQNVTKMGGLFADCESLQSLDLRSFNTGNVSEMAGMFWGCKSLKSVDLSSFDTSKVAGPMSVRVSMYEGMGHMFDGCSSLISLDLSNFNTEKVGDMEYMFRNCSSLVSLNLSSFNPKSLWTGFTQMMGSDWVNSGGCRGMFIGCAKLVKLDLSGFDLIKVKDDSATIKKDLEKMLDGCSALSEIEAPINVGINVNLPGTGWSRKDNGEEIAILPKALSESITISRGSSSDPGPNPSVDIPIIELAAKAKYNIAELMAPQIPEGKKIDKYKVDNKKIVLVNKKGIVTAKKSGTVLITAFEKTGKKSYEPIAYVTINVVKPEFKFTDKDLTYTGASVDANDFISNLPQGATVSWSVPAKKNAIAAVDGNGIITAGTKNGTVKVSCEISEGGYSVKYSANIKVKIPKPASTLQIKDGKTKKLTLKNVSKYTAVEWSSSSEAISIQSTGKSYEVKLTALSTLDPEAAKAAITITAVVDGKEYTTNVTIKQ